MVAKTQSSEMGWAANYVSFCRRFVGVLVGASYRGKNLCDPQGYRNMGQLGGRQTVSNGRGLGGHIDPLSCFRCGTNLIFDWTGRQAAL